MLLKTILFRINQNARTLTTTLKLPIYKNGILSQLRDYPSYKTQLREYSTQKSSPYPTLMQFNQIVWPSAFMSIKNLFLTYMVIKPSLDPDFNSEDFVLGTKQAVKAISEALYRGDWTTLESLVSKEAFLELQESVSKLSVSEREHLPMNVDDMYFAFPYQIGMIMEDDGRRWVEVTMVFHVLRGFTELKEKGIDPPMSLGMQPEYQQRLFVCNYRFIREYTKGVTDSWLVNVVNHFKLADFNANI